MSELWIPITLLAAFSQNLRSALQKHLKGRLSTGGATYARFLWAVPLAALYVTGLHQGAGLAVPVPNPAFAAYGLVGGVAQILATALLVHLFSYRNFAVGTAYSKTETVQAALFGLVLLGDPLGGAAVIGILVSLVGVMAISTSGQTLGVRGVLASLTERPALLGLGSGALFGVSAVCYRAASLSLGGEGFLMQAAFTLLCVTATQTVLMSLWLRWREPGQISATLRQWRLTALVGVAGVVGSAGWFTAMTLQNVAYVRALGQVELVFTFLASWLLFGERVRGREVMGIVLISAGLLVLLLGR